MSDELPKGWATASLSTIAEINPRHPKDLDGAMPVTFVPMAALSESKPGFQFTEERLLGEVRKGFTHFAERDVLFAKITPCMENGKGAVARGLQNKLGCGTTELHVIRPLADISAEYIYRFLAQDKVRRAAKENFTGTAGQARVPTSFIEELEVPLAPLAEQRRIVAKLETLMGKVDACQQRLTEIPVLLKRFRQSVLAAACSGRLTADWREETETSETDWKRFRLTDLLAEPLSNGRSVPDSASGFPVLRLTCLKNGRIDLAERKIGAWTADSAKKFLVFKGDFFVSRGNGSLSHVGRGGLVEETPDGVAFPDTLIRVRLRKETIEPSFLRQVWSAKPIREQIESAAHTTAGIWKISQKDLEEFVLPVPPLPEQQEIVRRVEGLFALADQIELRLAKARGQVDKLTPSLLARAFAGKLVPQDPNDEPAAALLDRIKAHHEPKSRRDARK